MSSSLRVGTSLGGVGSGVGGKVGGKVGGGKVGGEFQSIPHVQWDSQHVPAGQMSWAMRGEGGAGGGAGGG